MNFIFRFVVLTSVLFTIPCFSQLSEKDSIILDEKQFKKEDKVNDILLFQGWVDFSPEYYRVDDESQFIDYHATFQPYLSEKNIFQIEFGLVYADLKDGTHFTPGDLSLLYRRLMMRKEKKGLGYSGMGLGLKFTMPTGRKESFSGFNSWTIEPQIGFQWEIINANWLTAVTFKYNYSFASIDEDDPRFDYLRVDYDFGFENESWWLFFIPEYRYIPSKGSSTLYTAFDIGYKPSRKLSVKMKYRPRIIGSDFFETYFSLGLIWFLK